MPATQTAPANKNTAPTRLGSTSFSILTLAGALLACEEIIGSDRIWEQGDNGDFSLKTKLLGLRATALRTAKGLVCMHYKADRSIQVINAWLKEHGFDVELKDQPGKDGFAAGCILDLLVKWIEAGRVTEVYNERTGKHYPAFTLNKGFQVYEEREGLRAVIETQEGYTLNLMMHDDHPGEGFDLFERVMSLRSASRRRNCGISELTIPMIDFSQEVDLKWLIGLITRDVARGNYFIAEAIGQNKLRMNEKGARAQSAVAVVAVRGMSSAKSTHVIDRSFPFWIEKPGGELPLYCAYLTPDCWKAPADLETP